MERSQSIKHLSFLTKQIAKKHVQSREDWREWVEDDQDDKDILPEILAYAPPKGAPTADRLIQPHFHPKLPLIGWNYTKLAHNLIEYYDAIWTPVIRQCRGIVFDRDGKLIALPFEKFFNYSTGEHPETASLPKQHFSATEKHDGDLGIVFRYRGKLHVTTRGVFGYESALLAERMIASLDRGKAWKTLLPEGRTLLIEIVHPKTRHIRVYRKSSLILIGGYENATLHDFEQGDLVWMAEELGIESAKAIYPGSTSVLEDMMREPVKNREGYVARWPDGRRAKFKYVGHLGRMYAAALGDNPHAYVLKTLLSGHWDEKLAAMDDEPARKAALIHKDVFTILRSHKSDDARLEELLLLPPKNQRTNNYRALCRKFINDYA